MNRNNESKGQQPYMQHSTSRMELSLSIVFGTPSKNCHGIGICRMMESQYIAGSGIKCPHVPGFLSLDTTQRLLTIRFPKRFLTNQMVARHFCKTLFKVTESYKVPARFCRALGIRQPMEIKTGAYQVVETEMDLIVTFRGCLPGFEQM